VTALRGKKGGYLLSRRPGQISVADIIDAVDGPFGLTECSSRPGLCVQEPSCAVRGHWRRVSRAVRATLEAITLTQMTEPGARVVKAIAFHPRREGA
jgi:Rrf2 family protein